MADFDDWRRRRVAELYRERYGAVPSWYEDLPADDPDEFAELDAPAVLLPMPPGGMSGPFAP